MRWIPTLLLALVLPVALAGKGEKIAFTGEYQWKDGGNDRLVATFTPDGEESWKVKFEFDWNGKDYTWKGKATGSLTDGSSFEGTARSKNGRRQWRFTGAIDDQGRLTGSHTEITGGRNYETGTFELAR